MSTIALINGDFKSAELYAAKGVNAPSADDNLGNLYVAQGKYDQAAAKLGKSANNSAALAQILAKDYSSATQTLNAIKNPDALTFYLKAIVAARQNEEAAILTNLKQSIQKDSTYRQKALNDCEFYSFPNITKVL